MDHLLKDYM